MTALVVHQDAAELGIVHPVACVIHNVTVRADTNGALDHAVDRLMTMLRQTPATILARPEVRGFKDLFSRMGYPNQTPAGQRLIESFQKKGFKHHNNLVDAYNLASAWFGCGLGMHDAREITGDIYVLRATGEEALIPLFRREWVDVTHGDLIYVHDRPCGGPSGHHVMAWLGKQDVDADAYKVREDTTSVLLVALGNRATSEAYNRDACLKAGELIRLTCPAVTVDFLETRVETPQVLQAVETR